MYNIDHRAPWTRDACARGADLTVRIWPGQPYPLGAGWDGEGTNFVLFSEVAQRVELCLFDDAGVERRVDLPEVTAYSTGPVIVRREQRGIAR